MRGRTNNTARIAPPPQRRPFIGPCRDPLRLWFLEYEDTRGVWRRYFADRAEARAALKAARTAPP